MSVDETLREQMRKDQEWHEKKLKEIKELLKKERNANDK